MVDINDDYLTKAFFSGCETITNTVKATTINFNKYHLTVTYDATKDVTQSPQVKFHHSSGFVGIRLPTTNSKQIKWGYNMPETLKEQDKTLTTSDTWTFKIADDGTATLISPAVNSYTHSFSTVVSNFKGGSLEVGFSDFETGGVSCYEIYDPIPLKPSECTNYFWVYRDSSPGYR